MSIAIVTGGSRGLGKAIALRLAEREDDVIVTYHSKIVEAAAVAAQIEGMGRRAGVLRLDVSDSRSFAPFADEITRILQEKWNRTDFDFLVNNAGIGINAPFLETTEEQFDLQMRIHLKATFFLTQSWFQ